MADQQGGENEEGFAALFNEFKARASSSGSDSSSDEGRGKADGSKQTTDRRGGCEWDGTEMQAPTEEKPLGDLPGPCSGGTIPPGEDGQRTIQSSMSRKIPETSVAQDVAVIEVSSGESDEESSEDRIQDDKAASHTGAVSREPAVRGTWGKPMDDGREDVRGRSSGYPCGEKRDEPGIKGSVNEETGITRTGSEKRIGPGGKEHVDTEDSSSGFGGNIQYSGETVNVKDKPSDPQADPNSSGSKPSDDVKVTDETPDISKDSCRVPVTYSIDESLGGTSPSPSLSSSATLSPASSPITVLHPHPGLISSVASKLAGPSTPRIHPKPEKPVLRDRAGRKRNNSLDREFVTNFGLTKKERPKSSTPRSRTDKEKPRIPRRKPPFPKERRKGKPKLKVVRPGLKFEVGFRLEAMDSYRNKWYNARIAQVEEAEQMVLIHFDKWNSRWDEWVDCDSAHIRPMRNKGKLKARRKEAHVVRRAEAVPAPPPPLQPKAQPPPKPPPRPKQPQPEQPQPEQPQQEEQPPEMVGEFKYGEEVLARWSDCRYYPAKVLSLNKNGTYRMLFYDGIEKNVLGTNTRTMPDELKALNFFSNFSLPPAPVVKGKKRWSAKDQSIPESTAQAPVPDATGPTADPTGPTPDPTGPTPDPTGPTPDPTGPTPDPTGPTSPRTSKRRLSETSQAPLSPPLSPAPKRAKVEEKVKSPKQKVEEVKSPQEKVEEKVKSPRSKVTSPLPPPVEGPSPAPPPAAAVAPIVKPVLEPCLSPAKREHLLSRNIKEPLLNDKALGLLRERTRQLIAPKELVIDLDHNKYKCNYKDCDKSFRKESLLDYHKKYYHATKTRTSSAAIRVLSRSRKRIKDAGRRPSKVTARKRLSAPPELISSYQSRHGEKTSTKRLTKYPASVPRRRQSQSPPPVKVPKRQRHQSEPILAGDQVGDDPLSPLVTPTLEGEEGVPTLVPTLEKVVEGVSSGADVQAAPPPAEPDTNQGVSQVEDGTMKEDIPEEVEKNEPLPPVEEKTAIEEPVATEDAQKTTPAKSYEEWKKVVPFQKDVSDREKESPQVPAAKVKYKRRKPVVGRGLVSALVEDALRARDGEEEVQRHKHRKSKEGGRRHHHKKHKKDRRHRVKVGETETDEGASGTDGGSAEKKRPAPRGKFKQPRSKVSVRHSGTTPLTGGTKEVIKCVCKVTEEDGFMIQCETCFCWQHSACVGLSARMVPKRYICYYCQIAQGRKPPLFDLEDYAWFEKGELPMMPSFKKRVKRQGDRQAASLRQTTNSLLGDVITLVETLQGIQHKIAILQDPTHPEAMLWARDWILRSQMKGLRVPAGQSDSSTVSTPGNNTSSGPLAGVLRPHLHEVSSDVGANVELGAYELMQEQAAADADGRVASGPSSSEKMEEANSERMPMATASGAGVGIDARSSGSKVDESAVVDTPGRTTLKTIEREPKIQSSLKANTIISPSASLNSGRIAPGTSILAAPSKDCDDAATKMPPAVGILGSTGGKPSPTGIPPVQSPTGLGPRSSSKEAFTVVTSSGRFAVRRASGPIAEHNYVACKPRGRVQITRIGQPQTTFERPSGAVQYGGGSVEEGDQELLGLLTIVPGDMQTSTKAMDTQGDRVGAPEGEVVVAQSGNTGYDGEDMEVDVDDTSRMETEDVDEGASSGTTLSADEKPADMDIPQCKDYGVVKPGEQGSEVIQQEPTVELSQRYLLRHINTMHNQLSERLTLIEMEVEKLEKMFASATSEWGAASDDASAMRKKMRVLLGDLQKIGTIVSF